MRVEIVSDVVCPWCYIGKRRFETALDQLRKEGVAVDLTVSYRAFQLDPSAPLGPPTLVREAYAAKFGGEERAQRILANVTQAARAEGLLLRMDLALRANTRRAHRLLAYVRRHQPESQSDVNEAIMRAYFSEGRNIADPDTLIECFRSATHDAFAAAQKPYDVITGFDDEWDDEVDADLSWAASRDVTAVPTFVINDSLAVPGAQDASSLVRILKKMAAH